MVSKEGDKLIQKKNRAALKVAYSQTKHSVSSIRVCGHGCSTASMLPHEQQPY
jgi:hypothetical protein